MEIPQQQQLEVIIQESAQRYFNSRRETVAGFVNKHFQGNGARSLNKNAFGKDLLRSPANLIWAGPRLLIELGRVGLKHSGADKTAKRLSHIPWGVETDVQKEIRWRIYSELLELPCRIRIKNHQWESDRDRLLEMMLSHESLHKYLVAQFDEIALLAKGVDFKTKLAENLQRYTTTRAAAADLANSVIHLAAGAAAFHKLTPGALATTSVLAAAIANSIAINSFALGSTLGSVWYGWFPVSASMGTTMAVGTGVFAVAACIAAMAGFVTDPIQARFGIHQRRLIKLIDVMEADFIAKNEQSFSPKDHYVARVFDFMDVIRVAATLK